MAKRQGQKFWQAHLEAWYRSDLTQRDYCASHGLGEKSFYRWHRKERQAAAKAKSPLTLVPVSVGALASGNIVRLHSPGGWRVEFQAGATPWLADLLRQLP